MLLKYNSKTQQCSKKVSNQPESRFENMLKHISLYMYKIYIAWLKNFWIFIFPNLEPDIENNDKTLLIKVQQPSIEIQTRKGQAKYKLLKFYFGF